MALKKKSFRSDELRIGSQNVYIDYSKSKHEAIYKFISTNAEDLNQKRIFAIQKEKNKWALAKNRKSKKMMVN